MRRAHFSLCAVVFAALVGQRCTAAETTGPSTDEEALRRRREHHHHHETGGAPTGTPTAEYFCAGRRATIVGTNGADHIVGTAGADVIVALGGDDWIEANGGDDIICAGAGADLVYAGEGDDYVDGGDGVDTVFGGPGNDTIHGRDEGDDLHGGPGDDRIFGDILDDHLFGDQGNDVLVGGHGTDELVGGPGDDWLRGDTGNDSFDGGDGFDTASFATARPPGSGGAFDGVTVNLATGRADGDGADESITAIERVIGSPFRDHLIGNAHATLEGGFGDDAYETLGADMVVAGPGAPSCNGSPCPSAGLAPARPAGLFAFVTDFAMDTGVTVLGSRLNDDLTIAPSGAGARVTAVDGSRIEPGPGCVALGVNVVDCAVAHALHYVLVWGDDGDDTLSLGDDFGDDMTSTMDGGAGNDVVNGGNGQDILFGGMTGADTLNGGPGDDALLSLSYPWDHGIARTSHRWCGRDVRRRR